MGDRPFVAEVPEKTRPGPVRRGLGGSVEQYHSGRDQDSQTRHHGSEGLPCRGADHEETATRQADSTVRRLHDGGADLHHHGIDEKRQSTGILTRYARYGFGGPIGFFIIICDKK